jgi:hypothetical protein
LEEITLNCIRSVKGSTATGSAVFVFQEKQNDWSETSRVSFITKDTGGPLQSSIESSNFDSGLVSYYRTYKREL